MSGFNNPYMNPYGMNGYGQIQTPVMQVPGVQVTKVSGENGARAYQMGPNSSALLLDESGLMVWLCTTDGAGYKTVSAYDITPHKSEQAIQYDSLENRIKRLEEIINGRNTTDSSAVRKEQHHEHDSAGQANDGHDKSIQRPNGDAEPTRREQPDTETGIGYNPTIRGRFNDGIPGNC